MKNIQAPETIPNWELEPMKPKSTEASSIAESLDTKYAVPPTTEISPRDEARAGEILEGIQQLPRNTQESYPLFTEDLNKRTSTAPQDVKKYTQELENAFHKKEMIKKELTEGGPFSPIGAGAAGSVGLAFLGGSGLLAAVPGMIATDIIAVTAGTAPLISLAPAVVVTVATVAPFVGVGYFGYKLFKYFQAKREETNLKKRDTGGYALA
jgi:hypothetical protein